MLLCIFVYFWGYSLDADNALCHATPPPPPPPHAQIQTDIYSLTIFYKWPQHTNKKLKEHCFYSLTPLLAFLTHFLIRTSPFWTHQLLANKMHSSETLDHVSGNYNDKTVHRLCPKIKASYCSSDQGL